MDRRRFIAFAAGATGTTLLQSLPGRAEHPSATRKVQAIAFDGFVIFNPFSIVKRVEEVWPGKGAEFATAWRVRQFEYSWLRTAARQYVDFWRVTQEALVYAAKNMKLQMTSEQQDRLMESYRAMPAWPDIPDALREFRRLGIKLVFLSNLTAAMLDANLASAKLRDYFGEHLTTDLVRAYKPSPLAYQMGIDRLRLKKEEIVFAAFGAWDAAGAKWFGYPTVWVNRAGAPIEELDSQPDAITSDIKGLMQFVNPAA